jgi:hypothetical protein
MLWTYILVAFISTSSQHLEIIDKLQYLKCNIITPLAPKQITCHVKQNLTVFPHTFYSHFPFVSIYLFTYQLGKYGNKYLKKM